MSFLVVGDIHGSASQLRVLLEHDEFLLDRRVVFLGDYVDIGRDSPQVIDQLMRFRSLHPNSIFLQGNHDFALSAYLNSGDFVSYAQLGGIATIQAYCGEVFGDVHELLKKAIPAKHLEFLAMLQTHFETSDYLFSHCGYAPDAPKDRSQEAMVLRSHQQLFIGQATLAKLSVCGHYFQRTHKPFLSERVICLDTGCGILNGPLTALALPERKLVQVSHDLEITAF
jgi:serine/threonine protein phosphatase 1